MSVILHAGGLCESGLEASREAGGASSKVLRIGTLFYVDTLNPLVGIETNDTTASSMAYPQLVQYAPAPRLADDWATSRRSGPWDGCCVNAEAGAGNWRSVVAEHDSEGLAVAARFDAPECWSWARVEIEDERGRRVWGNSFVLAGAPPCARGRPAATGRGEAQSTDR